LLLERGVDVNTVNAFNQTPLHMAIGHDAAARRDNFETIRLLLATQGIDANVRSLKRWR
jgi:ankyrin repeat protein